MPQELRFESCTKVSNAKSLECYGDDQARNCCQQALKIFKNNLYLHAKMPLNCLSYILET